MNECGVLHKYRPYDKAPYVSGSAELGNSVMTSKFTNDIRQFLFGLNGLLAFYGADKYFYLNENDTSTQPFISIKGQTDIPGVLAAGSVANNGGQRNVWGAKANLNSAEPISGGFRVPLSGLSHNQYVIQITPNNNVTFRVGAKTATHFVVYGSGGFDYVVIGRN